MNTEQLSQRWKEMKGAAKQHWGKLSDADLDAINGRQDLLVAKIQERYGIPREEAQKRTEEWLRTQMQHAETHTAGGGKR